MPIDWWTCYSRTRMGIEDAILSCVVEVWPRSRSQVLRDWLEKWLPRNPKSCGDNMVVDRIAVDPASSNPTNTENITSIALLWTANSMIKVIEANFLLQSKLLGTLVLKSVHLLKFFHHRLSLWWRTANSLVHPVTGIQNQYQSEGAVGVGEKEDPKIYFLPIRTSRDEI
jgi:hypothetical protein